MKIMNALRNFLGVGDPADDLRKRILRYRELGSQSADPLYILRAPVITKLDHDLMRADKECAKANHSEVIDDYHLREVRWYRVANEKSIQSIDFPNRRSRKVGERWVTEMALMLIPKKEFQASPQEVAARYLEEFHTQ